MPDAAPQQRLLHAPLGAAAACNTMSLVSFPLALVNSPTGCKIPFRRRLVPSAATWQGLPSVLLRKPQPVLSVAAKLEAGSRCKFASCPVVPTICNIRNHISIKYGPSYVKQIRTRPRLPASLRAAAPTAVPHALSAAAPAPLSASSAPRRPAIMPAAPSAATPERAGPPAHPAADFRV